MDLFLVKRYESQLIKQKDPDQEERILQKLQHNIENKKRKQKKRNKDLNETNNGENVNDQPIVEIETEDIKEVVNTNEVNNSTAIGDKNEFTILGEDQKFCKEKVKRVLPSWLAYPIVISNDLSVKSDPIEEMTFLSSEIKTNLAKMGIKHFFPVQQNVIPWLLSVHSKPPPFRPRDLCVSAPTGSGKTIAFALPIVQLLQSRVVQRIRALIILPVRELAAQVFSVINALCKGTNLNCLLLSPKRKFTEEQGNLVKEIDGEFHSRVDILVTTAGRLVEHLHLTEGFCLKYLKFLVIDEADRVMDQIQSDWLYHLDNHVRRETELLTGQAHFPLSLSTLWNDSFKMPHKLLFSATLSQDPEKLENMKLFHPKLFTSIVTEFKYSDVDDLAKNRGEFIGKFAIPAELIEKVCETEIRLKPLTLFSLIKENNWKRFLCFTNNNDAAHRLAFVLQKLFADEFVIEELSSMLNKSTRNSILYKFSIGKIQGLVSSDTLARGMDLPNVDIVICYDCPRHIKTYIHRIGRTARAGKQGTAITIVTEEDKNQFERMLEEVGKSKLDQIKITSDNEIQYAKKYSNVLEELQKHLLKENKLKTIKKLREQNNARLQTENKSSFLGLLQAQMQNADKKTSIAITSNDNQQSNSRKRKRKDDKFKGKGKVRITK